MRAYLKSVLEKLLVGLVKDDSTNSFDVKNWQGELSYTNIELSDDFLKTLNCDIGLPLSLERGVINHLSLNLPWRNFFSDEIKLKASGFSLLLKVDIKELEEYR